MQRRVLVGCTLLLCAVSYWMVGRSPGADVIPDPPSSPPPVVSEAVKARLDALLDDPRLAQVQLGVEVRDCEADQAVYARQPDLLLNPASNLKLLTTAVALDTLGPAFRFKTDVLYDGTLTDGVLKGNLYLKGRGDPELVYEELWKLVKELQALGLRRVEGDIVADDSYFEQERNIRGWSQEVEEGDTQAYNPPLGALSVSFNTVALLVRPGERVGAPASIGMETPTRYVALDNRVTTGKPRASLSVSFQRRREGSQEILQADGRIPSSLRYKRYYRTITDPPAFAVSLFRELLEKEGVQVVGGERVGVAPESASFLHAAYSSSLDMLMKYMNKLSSNFIAEHALKAVGAKVYGLPGTTENGLNVARTYLSKAGLPWESAVLMNGSGLSLETRVSTHQFATLLCHAKKDFVSGAELIASLPISGIDGTLRNRMKDTPAQGRVRAKTGSVRGVFGFSGYVETLSGKTLAFSFLVNDITRELGKVRATQDRFMSVLVQGDAADRGGGAPVSEVASTPDEGSEESSTAETPR